jgi:glucosyl-3-phosphoglycerate synthase
MKISQHKTRPTAVSDWFAKRTYGHDQFADIEALTARKRELGVTLTTVLPAREVAGTIGPIVDEIRTLNEVAPLVDQIAVVDAGSADGTANVAAEHGAEVYAEDELVPQFGPAIGKGDAMWRALSIARGDLVAYLDSDTSDFGRHFVYGLLGPLLFDRQVRFVKATYSRPFKTASGELIDDAGRVTELTAKPLFNSFYPELCGFGQPLSGELIGSRELLSSIPFCTGYAVETAMMIDVLRAVGLDAMAQVELGARHNRSQPLFALGSMAYAVVRAVLMRADSEGRPHPLTADPDYYLHAFCPDDGVRLEERLVRIVERPPMQQFSDGTL